METANRPMAGIFWMLVTGACFVVVTALVKYLGDGVPAAQAAFLRYLLGLVFLIPMIGAMRNARYTKPALIQFGVRGAVHSLGVIMWFYAMTRIPIAEVTAMNYLSPVYVTIGAALFFGEKLAMHRILAVCVALLGAFVILRPGFRELNDGHFTMLGTAIFFAISYLMAKKFSGDFSATVVVAMLSLTVTIGLAPFAFAVWVTPSLGDLVILFAVASFATLGHLTMTLAFAAAPLTVTQPVTFLQLLWATLLGVLVFGEAVDSFVLIGGGMIISAISFITWREAHLRRGQITPSVPQTKS